MLPIKRHKHWFEKFVDAMNHAQAEEIRATARRMVWEGLRAIHRSKWTRDDRTRRFM